jgi:DNA-binding transcriptional ArsR family regulator
MSEQSAPRSSGGLPQREVGDPRVLRGLAHPLRMQIIDQLMIHGPLTATELGDRLGESPANCSWHLRQLAKHGFIEEAEGGTGRQRPWRMVPQSTTIVEPAAPEPDFDAARDALIETLLGQDLAAWRAWRANRHTEPEQWREAGFMAQSNYIWMTAEELAALKQELSEITDRHILPRLDRLPVSDRPPGSRPIRFTAWAVPSGPPHVPTDTDIDTE